MTDRLQLARDHAARGEKLVAALRDFVASQSDELATRTEELGQLAAAVSEDPLFLATVATANMHFAASMAHTNLLLSDPAEMAEMAEQDYAGYVPPVAKPAGQ